MFELSLALSYLVPRRRQLSVSIISLISIAVISLVVWLILVFFSVTNGLETLWIDKLTSLTAPIRITPTDAYYRSPYYLIDNYSLASNYTPKSIREKLNSPQISPYNPEIDEELPSYLTAPTHDFVKLAYEAIGEVPAVDASDYETTFTNLRLHLLRSNAQAHLSQASYIGSYDRTPALPLTAEDLDNVLTQISLQPESERQLQQFVAAVDLQALQDGAASWAKQPLSAMHRHELRILRDGLVEPLGQRTIAAATARAAPFWVQGNALPTGGILVPRSFRESGVLVGDRGDLSYLLPTASGFQEQREPIFVAGFYDPGIIPIGGKFLLGSGDLVSVIRSAQHQEENPQTNGINVRFSDLSRADAIKKALQEKFDVFGIAPYWTIETFRDFDFTKDIIHQLHSEKNIFTLISFVIILVACSNIISMLIILVNDKKAEIGILRAMGATSRQIATLFGFCGFIMGFIGSLIGIGAAYLTLQNLNLLVGWISRLQGYQAFNPLFFGENLPSTISTEALAFVLGATAITSLIAGIIPAIKACLLNPSTILRAE